MFIFSIVVGGVLVSVHGFSAGNRGVKGDSVLDNTHQPLIDYNQRQRSIHSHILHRFSGTYLDSMSIVIKLFSDSIQNELLKTKTKDSVIYFKACLNNALNDSIILDKLSKISAEKQAPLNFRGVFTTHCIDASNSFAIDSVAMDVFSGNSLITSALSDKLGMSCLRSIPGGEYSIVFSRRGYIPLSLMHFKITTTEQTDIEIPLKKKSGYLVQILCQNTWLCLTAGVVILLLIISALAYFMAKFMARRMNKNTK